MTGGSWHHHTGTWRGWVKAWLVKVACREEAPLQLMHLLGQDTLLIPGQVPATLQLALFFPEPLILQHKLLEHSIEVPLGPGHPGPTEPRDLEVHLAQLGP